MDNVLKTISQAYSIMDESLVYDKLVRSSSFELIVHIYERTSHTSAMLGDKAAAMVVHTKDFSKAYKEILEKKFKILHDDGGGIYQLSPEDLVALSKLFKDAKFKWSKREMGWIKTVPSAEAALEELKKTIK